MQDNFDYLSIDEYSLCQTTLEQVFNAFARQQVQNELGDREEAKEVVAPKPAEVENVPVETVSVFSKSKDDAFDIIRSCATQDTVTAEVQPEPEEICYSYRPSSVSSERDPVFSASVDRQNAAD